MRIRVYAHPFAPCAPAEFEVDNLARWLVSHYGTTPQLLPQIFEGQPSLENEITGDFEAIWYASAPEYVVLETPGEAAGLTAFAAQFLVTAALTVAQIIMAPTPQALPNVNRTQQSPNNALGARENQVRMLQRVEDIYGAVKAIPSLLMPTYFKYRNNQRIEYSYLCVGRGYYDISDVRDGDTEVGSITGASIAVYRPFHSPNDGTAPQLQIGPSIIDKIVSVRRSVETDGFTLRAENQIKLPPIDYYVYAKAGVTRTVLVDGLTPFQIPGNANDQILQFVQKPNFNALSEVGQTVTISGLDEFYAADGKCEVVGADRRYIDTTAAGPTLFVGLAVGDQIAFSGFPDAVNNGTFVVATKPSSTEITVTTGSQVDWTGYPFPTDIHVVGTIHHPGYAGTRTITEVINGGVVLDGTSFPDDYGFNPKIYTTVVVNNGLTDWTDWIILPSTTRTEVWINIVAPQGMYVDNGGRSPTFVIYELQIEQLDGSLSPTGVVETVSGELSGATTDEVGETLERVTAWTGPARVRVRRFTPFNFYFSGTVIDEIKWADLYSVSPVDRAHFGNKTTIHSVTMATPRATAVRNRQLNCLASRLLPTWNNVTGFSGAFDAEGRHVSGTIHPTAFIHDIIGAVSLDPEIGNRSLVELDMVQMSAQVDLVYAMHPEAPTFNYTFDSDNISHEETVLTIANAGFCTAYRQNNKVRLSFDRAQAANAAIYTHRNKAPNAETITRSFANDADYDGVELAYQDPDSQQPETIRLPLDGSYTKLKKLEIPGIRSFAQAWLRANREYRKLLGQRIVIETDTTTDARALLPNLRIGIVDNTRMKSFDGEVIAQAGLELTLSCDVEFTPAANHSIVLMRRDGSVQSINVTEVAGSPDKVLLQSVPSEAIVTEISADGIRTIFSFADDDTRAAQAYLVQTLVPSGEYIRLSAVNYSDDFYAMDFAAIPPKESVIN